MRHRARRAVLIVLVNLVFIPFIVEGALSLFDPLGMAYFNDQAVLNSHVIPHEQRGYALEVGHYSLAGFTANELPNHSRLLPDSGDGGCLAVFVGDSVTWGYGVDDAETWVNLVAKALPGVHVENPAYSGYNSENVRALIADYPQADVFIYLAVNNDDDASWPTYAKREQPQQPMLALYTQYVLARSAPFPKDRIRFERDMQAVAADSRVIVVAFDEPWGRQLADLYPWAAPGASPVRLIPHYTTRISAIDGHPDAAGNREIAAAILPIVKDAVARRCTAIV